MAWKTLSSKVIYDNPWMQVREDHVRNPGGGFNDYGYVHFKNTAVAILPVDTDGSTWLVGQTRYTLGQYFWELPMGGGPEGEDLLVSAQRELKEETGLSASHWHELMRLYPSNSITDEAGIVFVATGLTQGDPSFEETEDLSIRRLPFEAALGMVLDGEITDAISAAAILRYEISRKLAR